MSGTEPHPAELQTAGRDPTRAIARAVLYEGYVLWPYRKTAAKNRHRWTFGGVHPRTWTESGHEDDACTMRTECLVEVSPESPSGERPSIRVGTRFLQVVERRVARLADDELHFVDSVEVGGERHVAWEEAREREVVSPALPVGEQPSIRVPIVVRAASRREWLRDPGGVRRGAVVRSWRGLTGEMAIACARVREDLYRVVVEVSNTTDWEGRDRDDALRSTFASTHMVLRATGCAFHSLTDPPDDVRDAADACRNEGCWPVLAGAAGDRRTVLASPIILPDYPSVAPESPGDLFDGGEIDELLSLHILALTDEEREEMRAADPRTREILERTDSLTKDDLLDLHGTFRDPSRPTQAPEDHAGAGDMAPDPFWSRMQAPPPDETPVDGADLRRGSRVRLHPRPGGDVIDLALEGRTAIVEGIDEDEEGGIHLTVAVEDDPGRDLGMARHPGHRFFFRPEEVEPLVGRAGDVDAGEIAASPRGGAPSPDEDAAAGVESGRRGRGESLEGEEAADLPERPSILVAGVGNIFLGDDGFGTAVANRIDPARLPDGVSVRDFGISGLDLAYAFEDYDVAVLVDAVPGDDPPGTLHVIDASGDGREGPVSVETHGMDPVKVIAFARALGSLPERILVVGCVPAVVPDPQTDEMSNELSEPVRKAIDPAVEQVEQLVHELWEGRHEEDRHEEPATEQ